MANKAAKPNPALAKLSALVGEWQTAGVHPYVSDAGLHSHATIEWIEGGAFLAIRSTLDHPQFPDGIAIIGSDGNAKAMYMLYFDDRGISRKYDMALTGKQLKWWRNDPEFSQRFTLTIGKNQLASKGEMSRGGGAWEKDLALTYTRDKVNYP